MVQPAYVTACGTLALAERIIATMGLAAVVADVPVWREVGLEPELIRQADVAV